MSFFRVDRKRERETNFVDKLIHVSTANHYDSDGLCSLCDTAQSKKQVSEKSQSSSLKNQCVNQDSDLFSQFDHKKLRLT
jgi:hypothetical protein